jgi:peptide/nickel transport system ATP-binding protein
VEGSVLLQGHDVQKVGWGELRALRWAEAAMVFQGALHSLNPVQRIEDQIAEPIRLHDSSISKTHAHARVGELLEQVGLPASRSRSYPHQLSGGQRQRVMIAMALACRPKLIVADEPTTALDVMVQAQVLGVLTGLVRELGLGLLLISHDLSVLGTTCDRVVIMYAGRVVEAGPAVGLFDHPLHPYGGALAAAFPRVGDPRARFAPVGLPGDPPDPRNVPGGCPFHPRCALSTEVCTRVDPALEEKAAHRFVACHHADPDRDMKLWLTSRVAADQAAS